MDDTRSTKCQSIYRTLIQAHGVTVNSPMVFLRELEETARCDQYYDFSDIRAAYHKKVGTDSMERILNFKGNDKDEERAEQAIMHHFDWTQRNLVKALDWKNWIWYRTVYQVEQTTAYLTRAGGESGGWKFVRSRSRKWTQPGEQQQPV